jgi:hypothetical protein
MRLTSMYAVIGMVGHALVGHQLQETEVGARLVVGGHEGALALAAHDQVLGRELVDGLAHRALADLVAAGQLDFAGDQFARLPLAGLQALRDQRLDLLVQRGERGGGAEAPPALPGLLARGAIAVRIGRDLGS